MIKNLEKWREFEKELCAVEPIDVARNFAHMEALYEEALALGVLPARDPLEGLDLKLRIVRTIHRVQRSD